MIKIGVIGIGTYGIIHLDALCQREKFVGDIKVVGFAEINEKRRAEIEAEYGLKGYPDHLTLLEKAGPDAVTLLLDGRCLKGGYYNDW